MMIRMLKLGLGAPLILAAALVAGPCRVSFGAGRCGFGSARFETFHRIGQRRYNAFSERPYL